LLLDLWLRPVPAGRFDRQELAFKVVVPVLRVIPGRIDGSKRLEPISRQEAPKIVLTLDMRQVERARRDGSGKIIVPVIVI